MKKQLILILSLVLFPLTASYAAVTFESLPNKDVYNDFVVGPGKIEINLDPGQSKSFELTVSNRLGTDKTFVVHEEDFIGSNNPNETYRLLGNDRGPYSLKDYVKMATTSVFVSHGTKTRIPITVSVPRNAQPGGYYGSVIVGTATEVKRETDTNGISTVNPIVTQIGVMIFVRISGPVNESGKLVDFSISNKKNIIWDPGSVRFQLMFKNEGNIHLKPSGTITINNMIGSNVANIDVDPWFAMPDSLRFREVEWKPNFLFGRYVAHATIGRGYGNLSDDMEIVFWVIPWKLILIVIVSIVVLVTLLKWIFSRFKIARK
jgi:hypothetical protein